MEQVKNTITKIWRLILSLGPGIFCIGYTIGTGSVTAMIKSGSQYGMQLLWVLFLSAFFAWILMNAFGRFAAVTGETAIHSFRTRLRYGRLVAVLTIVGIVIGQWNSLSGILGLSAHAIYEMITLFIPGTEGNKYWWIISIAVIIIVTLYGFLLIGRYSFFEKLLIVFVSLMGLSFIVSMFIVMPPLGDIVMGFIPSIPAGGSLMVAAFVGTTMAAPTFIVRPLLVKEKGWDKSKLREQSRDALISSSLMFFISATIMVVATGALFYHGRTVDNVLDMVYSLEPIAGKFAIAVFMVGTLSAGLSSVFPILMVAPLLIGDYRNGTMDTKSGLFKGLAAFACLIGLTVPVLGANPIIAQIATQVANVFVLPLIILGIIYLINNQKLMGRYKAGIWLNMGLFSALLFSIIISVTGIIGLKDLFFGT